MRLGFHDIGCKLGVPMVANPTSEAWLLCGLKSESYQNCVALETGVSASDKSLRWGKKLVAEAIAERTLTHKSFRDLVTDGDVDTHRINMPSFKIFRDRLVDVVALMVRAHP